MRRRPSTHGQVRLGSASLLQWPDVLTPALLSPEMPPMRTTQIRRRAVLTLAAPVSALLTAASIASAQQQNQPVWSFTGGVGLAAPVGEWRGDLETGANTASRSAARDPNRRGRSNWSSPSIRSISPSPASLHGTTAQSVATFGKPASGSVSAASSPSARAYRVGSARGSACIVFERPRGRRALQLARRRSTMNSCLDSMSGSRSGSDGFAFSQYSMRGCAT